MSEAATATKADTTTVEDVLVTVVHEIETLDKDGAYDAVTNLEDEVEFSYFRLGGLLNRINEEAWYADEGFGKFADFVEDRFGIKRSKAMHLIKIYNDLIVSGVTWEQVGHIGWSKLAVLSGVLTKKNVKGWVKKAEGNTVMQLQELVRSAKATDVSGSTDDTDAGETVSKVSGMTFKVHEDQKEVIADAIAKAKGETGTEFNNVALESICLDYLAGPSKPVLETDDDEPAEAPAAEAPKQYTKEGLKDYMSQFGYMEVLDVFEVLFPDVDLTVHED